MKLSELKNHEKGIIVKIRGRGAFRKRLTEMGFVKGKEITVIKKAPLSDPIEYDILGYKISLRRSEAELVEVITNFEIENIENQDVKQNISFEISETLQKSAKEKSRMIHVALVGNPNCGKTSLFNFAAKENEHVGNYSGVTVDVKESKFKHNEYEFFIADLPGTYSLTAYSPEELFVRNYISQEMPDVVINVIDATNLERNLYLTTQLIDMDVKVVGALNMYDELLSQGDKLDYLTLSQLLGIPFVPTIASKGKGIKELFDKIIEVYEDKETNLRHIHIYYGNEIEISIQKLQFEIKKNLSLTDKISSRFLSIKLLEKDKQVLNFLDSCKNKSKIEKILTFEISRLERLLDEDTETLITDARYGFISGAIKETFKEGTIAVHRKTEIIDTFLTHKVFGFPVFIFFMWAMFQSTFTFGQYPMDFIESLISILNTFIKNYFPDGMLKDLISDGIINGVGGVIVFLPNILILFFFISLMEDTGYLARVAFIMDKLMHNIGLHGKSFIPLLMGFGCNVPAIMATRTLENRSDRFLTILINPLISCSARLPVYLVIIGAIFPKQAGSVLFAIYLTSIGLAVLVAMLFKRLIFKSVEVPFVMELPPYRFPTFTSIFRNMWHKGGQYLKKMGGIILVASILIWAAGYFPKDAGHENSYIAKVGKTIEPALKPLGFDWKIGVSILSGVAGKEVVVSTLGVLYNADHLEGDSHSSLSEKLRNETNLEGKKVFDPITSLSFLFFILIYFPCIATVSAIRKETESWKWAIFTIFYTTSLAWLVSFLIYQVGRIFY